ncbi:hypothetical protein NXC14_PA00031 (plasmid) [Rhizobium sp. NXC14]|uniref:hypothetical protein n=1 Tax=Rhizobium sp. NXC14 TaxID=1981173 RepID=UPI000A20B24D|nr:hypothetical protein [Rhizobium sp. NXC14]ARO32328.1 hypothetical protein NXC14_PA00031 [Rhizobium sp. NXC14]
MILSIQDFSKSFSKMSQLLMGKLQASPEAYVFLANGGDPNVINKPLEGCKPGAARTKELDFWIAGVHGRGHVRQTQ